MPAKLEGRNLLQVFMPKKGKVSHAKVEKIGKAKGGQRIIIQWAF